MASRKKLAGWVVLGLAVPALLSAQTAIPQKKPAASNTMPAKTASVFHPGKHTATKKNTGKRAKKAAPGVPVAPAPVPAQAAPPVPATLMNSPAVPAQVMLRDGELSIDAPNSTLSDVLNGVHQATGAAIEGPAPSERIAVKLGPGSPEQVLNALLEGTPYDYIIVGETGAPQNITRIVLSSRNKDGEASNPPEATFQQQNEAMGRAAQMGHRRNPAPQPETPPEQPEENNTDDSAGDAGEPAATPQQQQPSSQPDEQQQSSPKTPEQLFREMQQRGQQNQAPPN